MRLCVQNGGIYERFTLDESYKMIKEAGFDSVDYNVDHVLTAAQIRAGEKTATSASVEAVLDFIKPAKAAMEKYGIKVNQMHAPFPAYTGNPDMDEYVKNAIKYSFYAAKELDCKYVVVHEGFPPFEKLKSKKEIFDWNIAFYTDLIPAAKENGVIICLENLFSGYTHSGMSKIYAGECADMAEANRYIETLNKIAGEERFGFCFDVGHANLMGKRIYDCLMEIGPHLKVLHVHDNNGIADQHLFPYNGNIFWDDFIRGIRDCGYKGALSFETFCQVKVCDRELVASEMRLLGDIGRLFIKKIEA